MAREVGKNPENTVVPILRQITGQRKARAFFMRKATANLMERLMNAEQDAMIQISVYRQLALGDVTAVSQFRYGEKVDGTETYLARTPAEHRDFVFDAVSKYGEWAKIMSKTDNRKSFDICIAVCSDENSIKKLAVKGNNGWRHVFNLFRFGLGQWMDL